MQEIDVRKLRDFKASLEMKFADEVSRQRFLSLFPPLPPLIYCRKFRRAMKRREKR